MRKREDKEQRGVTKSKELRGRRRWRTKIEKQNGRESLGFFHLKLKLKRCVSHLEFRPVLAPVRPESAYFGGFG